MEARSGDRHRPALVRSTPFGWKSGLPGDGTRGFATGLAGAAYHRSAGRRGRPAGPLLASGPDGASRRPLCAQRDPPARDGLGPPLPLLLPGALRRSAAWKRISMPFPGPYLEALCPGRHQRGLDALPAQHPGPPPRSFRNSARAGKNACNGSTPWWSTPSGSASGSIFT